MTHLCLQSPIGPLTLFSDTANDDAAIIALEFGKAPKGAASPLLTEAARQLDAYFTGRLKTFDLPLAPAGTPFQQRVWRLMVDIPIGHSRAYGDLARDLKSSARAVGGACGRNPIAIIIPCHRVLAANGRIGGYSGGGGADTKRILLNLEGHKDPS